jgi:hypothetical protein
MLRILMAASAAFFLVCAPVYAAKPTKPAPRPPACTPLAQVKEKVPTEWPSIVLDGDDQKRAVAWLVENIEGTDPGTNFIFVVRRPDRSLIVFAGKNAAICQKGILPPRGAEAFVKAAMGVEADAE